MIAKRKQRTMLFIVPAYLLLFWLALSSMVDDSPVMDEQNHLGRGTAFALTGDPRLNVEHPTLVNGFSGAMLHLLPDVTIPTDHKSWNREPPTTFWYDFASIFLWEYNVQQFYRLIFLGRLPILFLFMLLAAVAYRFAQTLWGGWAGLAAFTLVLFDPNLIAHARYITTDMGGTTFVFIATAVIYWRWQKPLSLHSREGSISLALMGLVMGFAFTSKLLALVFVPIWTVLAFLMSSDWRANLWRVTHLWLSGFVSIFVVWAIFAFEWGPFLFLSDELAFLNTFSGPMPTFWSGIERITLLSSGGRPSFLMGEFSTEGFPLYFPITFLVKTPLLTLILLPAAAGWLLFRPKTRRGALFLLIAAVMYFAISMTSALNIGYRHLMPILPFIAVLIAGLFGSSAPIPSLKRFMPAGFLIFLLPALWIYPHYLSFFNLAAGGPDNGHQILIDSNIDWGQDIGRLSRWMDVNEVDSIKLALFGSVDPVQYGVQYEPLPGLPRHFNLWWEVPFDSQDPEPGIYVISVTMLWELPKEEKDVFPWFREREPDEKIGYSLFVYVVE